MTTFTPKGLIKPGDGDSQDVEDLNTNYDRLDLYGMGPFVCTSTTRPTGGNRWDGMLIWETDTQCLREFSAASTTWKLVGPAAAIPSMHAGVTDGFQPLIGTSTTVVNLSVAQSTQGSITFDAAADAIVVVEPGIYTITGKIYATASSGYKGFGFIRIVRAAAVLIDIPFGIVNKVDASDYFVCGTVQYPLIKDDQIKLCQSCSVAGGSTYGTTGYNGAYLEATLV